ncbi:hypothetical protein RN001_010130 [Aquatica leii]|uniref:LITAF domain-containing protein n=1 Tax=Aquatica leii TaxID=1421715 RepID=A0AAN7PUG3_9COLE|nr:hypothetical protein RN001_010130 [Aquatica leii]
MGSVVKCGLCGDTIAYTSSKIAQLGEHLFTNHSKHSLTNFTFDNGNKSLESLTPSQKYRMYKTTAHSSLGAICLLGCWPLCFLPFMLGGSNIMNIHCKGCGQYLGTFDRKSGRMQSCDDSVRVCSTRTSSSEPDQL